MTTLGVKIWNKQVGVLNEYMTVGQSKSGVTRAFAEGLPLVIEYPCGSYQSTIIRTIDWEAGTFRTKCSTYHFHFLG